MTQAELGARLDANQVFVSRYEASDRKVNVVELCAICDALDVSALEFVEQLLTEIAALKKESHDAQLSPPANAPDAQNSKNGHPAQPIADDDEGQDLAALRAFFKVFRLKWAACVLAVLASAPPHPVVPRPLRRRELSAQIPNISEKVLTSTLRHLQAAGLVHREPFATVPLRVEYSLTEQGYQFWQPLGELECWCRENSDVLEQAIIGKAE